ncbi:hypothetical protein BDZ91DRAFT_221733 [Kalaharituber pfeilii]|nr:hypothetical protein BDZ91DRAFT_221733 [Kalaharituber pfeilii]
MWISNHFTHSRTVPRTFLATKRKQIISMYSALIRADILCYTNGIYYTGAWILNVPSL